MAPTVPIEYTGRKEPKTYSQRSGVVMTGKAKKFSKGNFVPDYRHEVDTMAESEGFGSSGKVDTEMTASEDSCAPKRKVISLNVDGYDQYGTSLQILSLSKMSQSERKGLMMKLKSELEQVKLLQKKIVSLDLNGQQRPQVESFQRPVEVSTSLGKKRAPPGRNGPRAKRPTARRLESVKQAGPPSTSIATLMKQCETLLNRLMLHQYGWVFNTPVDVVKLNIPDYFNVIKHPMDLGTVKSKLLSGEYLNPLGFAADVRLTFSNAMTYNPPGNDVYIMADTLAKYFEVRWKLIEKKVSGTIDAPVLSTSSVHIETETPNPVPPSKKKKITPPVVNTVKQEPVKPIMTDVEKHKLSTELEALLAELPENIIDFLKKQSQNASQTDEDEIEIDLDALSDDTLLALRKLLDDHLLDRQKMQGKAEPCEMELNNSGFSNSPVQPLKGNDPIEDDVDIGGNDPPISSYPPVEIEKDTALRNSKCSSSSSSSSKSGSSSSDSDSGSSSCSKSDGARASIPAVTTMENIGSGANIEQKGNDPGDSDIGNRSLNGLNQVAQNFQLQVVACEGEGCQEGESAPPGRQVSPDKLYRAALLRSRFADTIIKAQEKTLEKVEKQDPRRLRLEREELERRRIEEKARLQAEAKTAEEARRKAEAEAAAEARRKRELERQAARQALQQMEKTVDINENCQFMEDLELLRAAPVEQIFIDDASPDHSENGLGSFKFEGNSNPLEQLGLYMKADDEEEEEGDPESVPDAVDDMEEEEGEPNSVPDVVNDMDEGEGELESVLEAVNGMEVGEGEPGSVPVAVNGMEEGEGEPKSVPDAVDHAEEEDEPKSVLADDAKEGEPKSVSAAVVDAEEGEID